MAQRGLRSGSVDNLVIACSDVSFLNVALDSKGTIGELQSLLTKKVTEGCRVWFQDAEQERVLKVQASTLSNLLQEASMAVQNSSEIEALKIQLGEHLEKASGEKMLGQVTDGFATLMAGLDDEWQAELEPYIGVLAGSKGLQLHPAQKTSVGARLGDLMKFSVAIHDQGQAARQPEQEPARSLEPAVPFGVGGCRAGHDVEVVRHSGCSSISTGSA